MTYGLHSYIVATGSGLWLIMYLLWWNGYMKPVVTILATHISTTISYFTRYSCQTRYGILAISCWMHYLVCIILVAERWFYHTGSYTLVRTYTCEPVDHIILAITYWLQHIGYDLLAITYWSWCNGYVSTVLLRYSTCPLHADKHLLEGSTIRPLHAFINRF